MGAATPRFPATDIARDPDERSVPETVGTEPGVSETGTGDESGVLHVPSQQPAGDTAVLAAIDETGYRTVRAR